MLTNINHAMDKLTPEEDKSRWLNGDSTEGLSSELIVLSSWDNIGFTMKMTSLTTDIIFVKFFAPAQFQDFEKLPEKSA